MRKDDGAKAIQLLPRASDAGQRARPEGRHGADRSRFAAATANGPAICSTPAPTSTLAAKDGDTPLIAAARIGFDDAIGWLTKLGAKVDSTNKLGETALIIAVQARNARAVEALLDAGADPTRATMPAIRRAIMPSATRARAR